MDESLIDRAMQLCDDIQTINDFLLKGLVPEDAQLQLVAKSCVLLGELDNTLGLLWLEFNPSIDDF